MAITKILAKDFKTRSDLENYVRNLHGLTPDKKVDVVISGKRDELARLELSDRTVFWGISCTITDKPTVAVEATKADRGVQTPFGINKNK